MARRSGVVLVVLLVALVAPSLATIGFDLSYFQGDVSQVPNREIDLGWLLGWWVGWLADDRLALGRRTERLQLLGAERQRLWHHPGDRWHWYVSRSIETASLSQTPNSRRCWLVG